MRRGAAVSLLAISVALLPGKGQAPASTGPASASEIREILRQRIDESHQSVGIVVGVVGPGRCEIVSYGALGKGDTRTLDGDTVFEIGSVTKVFTSLLLADMAQRGQLALSDPVSKYLPETVKMPKRGDREITLQDLATHTSGLPRLPGNLAPKDRTNPYADYSVTQLYEFLSSYSLTRDIGARYEYSNLGVGLLGHALARRAGVEYEELVRDRIIGPLRIKSTSIRLSPEMKARLAQGHDPTLNTVANWDVPTLAGAGALRSTANDMLAFLAAILGYTKTPLAPAMATMTEVRKPTGIGGLEVGLAWHISSLPEGGTIVWHNGGTGGYRSFIGYDPETRVGVVALSNAGTQAGVDDIGRHLVNRKSKLLDASAFRPRVERKKISVDSSVFDRYTGRYELGPNAVLTISREGEHFYAQMTGQPKVEIFAESEKKFFLKVVDAQITFEADGEGSANQLILHQAGRNLPAKRVE